MMTTITYACGHEHRRNLPRRDFGPTEQNPIPFVERVGDMTCRACIRDNGRAYYSDGSAVKAALSVKHGTTVKAARSSAHMEPLGAAGAKRVAAGRKAAKK